LTLENDEVFWSARTYLQTPVGFVDPQKLDTADPQKLKHLASRFRAWPL
jgi:hypothetical protein